MNNNPLRIARLLLPGFLFMGLYGCASAPEEPVYEEPEPLVEVEAPPPAPVPEPVVVKKVHPQRYVVVEGDTLWDIAQRFLRDPWRWPEVWQNNPQVANPHLIYPGDILTLIYIDGQPYIQVQRGDTTTGPAQPLEEVVIDKTGQVERIIPPAGTVRLSPRIRIEGLERAIPTIPIDAIKQFLSRPRIVTKGELEHAPYVVGTVGEHMIAGADHSVYVMGIDDKEFGEYVVVREGEVYRDPEDNDILGYEAIYVADGRVRRLGNPSTVYLESSSREVLNGDRLLPPDDALVNQNFMPHAPADPVKGRIISVYDGVTQIGQFQIVALNLGHEDNMEQGHVLAVYQKGERIRDPVKGGKITLPDERAGIVMVFRVFERVSYALVMSATRAMHVMDKVVNP